MVARMMMWTGSPSIAKNTWKCLRKKGGDVMTTHDYDSDANFFAYYFPITTPSLGLLLSLVLLLSLPLYSYHAQLDHDS